MTEFAQVKCFIDYIDKTTNQIIIESNSNYITDVDEWVEEGIHRFVISGEYRYLPAMYFACKRFFSSKLEIPPSSSHEEFTRLLPRYCQVNAQHINNTCYIPIPKDDVLWGVKNIEKYVMKKSCKWRVKFVHEVSSLLACACCNGWNGWIYYVNGYQKSAPYFVKFTTGYNFTRSFYRIAKSCGFNVEVQGKSILFYDSPYYEPWHKQKERCKYV